MRVNYFILKHFGSCVADYSLQKFLRSNCAALSKVFSVNNAILYLNLILVHFDRNIDKCWASLANCLHFLCLKLQKCGIICIVSFNINYGSYCCGLTWYQNVAPQLRSYIALQLNQKVYCGTWAALQKLEKFNCAFYWLKRSLRFVVLRLWYPIMLFVPASGLWDQFVSFFVKLVLVVMQL